MLVMEAGGVKVTQKRLAGRKAFCKRRNNRAKRLEEHQKAGAAILSVTDTNCAWESDLTIIKTWYWCHKDRFRLNLRFNE